MPDPRHRCGAGAVPTALGMEEETSVSSLAHELLVPRGLAGVPTPGSRGALPPTPPRRGDAAPGRQQPRCGAPRAGGQGLHAAIEMSVPGGLAREPPRERERGGRSSEASGRDGMREPGLEKAPSISPGSLAGRACLRSQQSHSGTGYTGSCWVGSVRAPRSSQGSSPSCGFTGVDPVLPQNHRTIKAGNHLSDQVQPSPHHPHAC